MINIDYSYMRMINGFINNITVLFLFNFTGFHIRAIYHELFIFIELCYMVIFYAK